MQNQKYGDEMQDEIENSASLETALENVTFRNEDLIPATPLERDALEAILRIYLNSTQIDFTHYRQTTILRRIARRMSLSNKNSYAEYFAFLENNPDEIEQLYDDLLLSHTEFFRDPAVFDALKENIFPSLVKHKSLKMPIRIWVAGCSTGEEVYSLAINLHEYLTENKHPVAAQFFGTDLNQRHIVTARRGAYPEKIRKNISDERLLRYFDQTSDGLRVIKQIREMCVFAVQDVTHDPPFPAIDLVSCRNVLIYFDSVLQETVIPLFHFALRPSGFLLLGSSETMGKFPELFIPVNQKINLYSKRYTGTKPMYRFPVNQITSKSRAGLGQVAVPITVQQPTGCQDITKKIDEVLLSTYAPPCLLVDCSMQIRQFRGHTSPFLTPASGEASLKLSKMTSEGLMPDIYVAIEEAKKKKGKISKKNITFRQHDTVAMVDLSVMPILDPSSGETCFLITFEKLETPAALQESFSEQVDSFDNEQVQLKNELQSTKEHLQSIIDEKDEVNQELWAANEEIQSTNEELQSVNEEMEAAKEELESSNEELIALNEELRSKNVELIDGEKKFRSYIENALDGVFVIDSSGFYRDVNAAACSLLGYTRVELLSMKASQIIAKEHLERFQSPFDSIKGDGRHSDEFNFVRKDGSIFTGLSGITKVDENQFLGFIKDITARKQAEIALRESEYFFKESQRAGFIGSYKTDFTSGFWESSEVLDQIFGIDKNYNRNIQGWLDIVHPDDREMMRLYVTNEVVSNGKSFNKEYRIIRKSDNECRWVNGLGKVDFDYEGKVVSMIGTVQDITERMKTEIVLQNTQKLDALGVLAGGIAHDFNNLLGGIFGNIDLAIDEAKDCPATVYLSNAMDTIGRARGLTGQLLTFAKGGSPIRQLTSLVSFVQETASFALSGSNVSCRFEVAETLWWCNVDKFQIGQVIDNIIINAKQAMPNGGNIVVKAQNVSLKEREHPTLMAGNYVMISIEDAGFGIPKEIMPRIFDPFFSTKAKGHGLGLSTCYSIINRHGGSIDVESEPSKGSVFYIYLPAPDFNEGAVENTVPVARHRGSGTIIIMDDEEAIRELMEKMLQGLGYSVVCKNEGSEALKFFKEEIKGNHTIVGLVFDLTVPGGMGGVATVKEIRKLNSRIPVFVVSGYADDPIMINPSEYGFTASICKPFKKNDLVEMLNKYLCKG